MAKLHEEDACNYRLLHGEYFEQRSIAELAEAEGLSVHAVECRLGRARQRLYAWMLEHEGTDTDSP